MRTKPIIWFHRGLVIISIGNLFQNSLKPVVVDIPLYFKGSFGRAASPSYSFFMPFQKINVLQIACLNVAFVKQILSSSHLKKLRPPSARRFFVDEQVLLVRNDIFGMKYTIDVCVIADVGLLVVIDNIL